MSNKKKDNPLAAQLARLDLDLPDASEKDIAPEPEKIEKKPAPTPEEKPKKPAPDRPDTAAEEDPPEQSLSDEELFQKAFEEMDPARLYDAKFRGQAGADLPDAPPGQAGSSESDISTSPEDEEKQRENVQQLRAATQFKDAIGDITPLEGRDKYRRPNQKGRALLQDQRESERQLSTPSLPRDGKGLNTVSPLDHAQRKLLKRYQRYRSSHEPPELYLRGDKRKEAIQRLASFIETESTKDAPFVRIIHGRGLQSDDGEPVIKPAVLEWLEGPGLQYLSGYVPELTPSRDYGSLIVELSVTK